MAEIIDFPRERIRAHGEYSGRSATPCLILILPVVRIERDDPPLLGRRQTRRCRNAIDRLRGLNSRQVIVDDIGPER